MSVWEGKKRARCRHAVQPKNKFYTAYLYQQDCRDISDALVASDSTFAGKPLAEKSDLISNELSTIGIPEMSAKAQTCPSKPAPLGAERLWTKENQTSAFAVTVCFQGAIYPNSFSFAHVFGF